jgi:phosphate transport system permease protein
VKITDQQLHARTVRRRLTDKANQLIFLASTLIGIIVLMILIVDILHKGVQFLRPELFTNFPSRMPNRAGLFSAWVGSAYLLIALVPLSFIVGVGAAIYLEEYAKKGKITNFVQICISTLAGVPSIVYGILGLTIFVQLLNMGNSLLAGILTMTLLVLPVIIVSSQEAIKAVPAARRDASFALGATKWQTVQNAVLPSAIPGILTGVILSVSRAIGETAPLVVVGAATFVPFLPSGFYDQFTVLPLQIYNWIGLPRVEFQYLAASGIIVLLVLLILMNIIAIVIRNRYQNKI